ncbi:MAG: hypothetical protein SFU27_10260 [Thermonemataceae bacterium]|nr:hypothetical protein [Thermonemataceae bacterium]
MIEKEREGNPLERALPYILPNEYDVLITDINDNDLESVGRELNVARLSSAEGEGSFPVRGIMYGGNVRMFVPLVVKKRGVKVNAIFLIDSGSPNTYLRQDTLASLGFIESMPFDTSAHIHGYQMTVYRSRGHFENVDLLGQDFMRFARVQAHYNYKDLEISLNI